MRYRQIASYITFGMVVFAVIIVISAILQPESLFVNNGISHYGVQAKTSALYATAFIGNALLFWWLSESMKAKTRLDVYMKIALAIAGMCYVGLVLAPRTTMNGVHRVFASGLFITQFVSAVLIIKLYNHDLINKALIALASLSTIAIVIYVIEDYGYLLQSQVVFQVAVWTIIIRFLSSRKLNRRFKILNLFRK